MMIISQKRYERLFRTFGKVFIFYTVRKGGNFYIYYEKFINRVSYSPNKKLLTFSNNCTLKISYISRTLPRRATLRQVKEHPVVRMLKRRKRGKIMIHPKGGVPTGMGVAEMPVISRPET